MKNDLFLDTQCIFCKSTDLAQKVPLDDDKTIADAIECKGCHKVFPSIFGLPYLGSFGESDVISLVEISSFSDRFTATDEKGALKLTNYKGLNYLDWIRAIEEYATADKPEGVLKKHFDLDQEPSWFGNRLREHLSFNAVTTDIDFHGKRVLDIGAGSGFDSLKYFHRGAMVTAMEFNPILAAVGMANFPQIRWVGGSSYTIPFADHSFDYVTANAALHHLLNIPRTMEEMLRVLKPGGKIITISDSFTAAGTSELEEAKIFNNHPDVLMGLNEQSPSFDKFVKVLNEKQKHLKAKFYTHTVHNLATYSRSWTFEEANRLLANHGGYFASIVIDKLESFDSKPKTPEREIISPYAYTISLADQPTAMNILSEKIPELFINLSVLSPELPKFRLMNGWKLLEEKSKVRRFFKRGRLFFSSEKISGKTLNMAVSCAYFPEYDSPAFSIYLNNEEIYSASLTRGTELPLSISLPKIDAHKKNSVIEFRFKSKLEAHDANVAAVSEILWNDQKSISAATLAEKFGIETLLETHYKDIPELTVLLSTDIKHGHNVINRMRKHGKRIKVTISSGQENFYSWIPHVEITGAYPDYNVSPEQFKVFQLTTSGKVDLVVASNDGHAELLVQKSAQILQNKAFRILENGFGRSLH